MTDTQIDSETVQDVLEAVNARVAAIQARQNIIPGELAKHHQALGEAMVSRTPTAKIHKAIDFIEVEMVELDVELEALQPVRARAAAAVKQAEREAAAHALTEFSRDAGIRSIRIFKQLDQTHIELCELLQIQDKMSDLQRIAGSLAADPGEVVSIPVPKIWHQINRAMEMLILWNGRENLIKHGIRLSDFLTEYNGQAKLPNR